MSEISDVSRLIGVTYDAALDPAKWSEVLAGLCSLTNSRASAVHLFDPQDNNKITFGVEFGTDSAWADLLHSTYAAICPLGPFILMADVDEPGSMFDFIDEAEFMETRFYKEWCAPQGYYDMAGAIIAKTEREIGTLSLMRDRASACFTMRERELIGVMAPHIRRAMTISGLLQHRSAEIGAFSALMETLLLAVLIVDDEGRIIQENAAARQFKEQMLPANSDLELPHAIKEVIAACDGRPELVPVPGSKAGRHMAAVIPLDRARRRFGILIHAPAPAIPAMGKPLAAAFGLTPREVAVLMPLLQGQEPAEIASALGVSLATIRTHLARLFAKTNTTRQADLIRVVMQTMPPVRSP